MTSKAVATTTQSKHPWRATIRTGFAVLVGLAALTPFVLDAISNGDPASLGPGAATALSVSAAITRVMALPMVEQFIARFLPWLAADPSSGAGGDSQDTA